MANSDNRGDDDKKAKGVGDKNACAPARMPVARASLFESINYQGDSIFARV